MADHRSLHADPIVLYQTGGMALAADIEAHFTGPRFGGHQGARPGVLSAAPGVEKCEALADDSLAIFTVADLLPFIPAVER